MRFELFKKKALLAHFNGRSEVNGEERVAAGDIKLRVSMENKILREQFHPSLLSALYFHDSAVPQDIVDKMNEENIDHLPHRRFVPLEMPLKWKDEMVGGKLTIHQGLGGVRSDLVISDIKLNGFEISAKDGGTVEILFRVQCHPGEKEAGKLYSLIQQEVEVSIEPPKEEQGAFAGT